MAEDNQIEESNATSPGPKQEKAVTDQPAAWILSLTQQQHLNQLSSLLDNFKNRNSIFFSFFCLTWTENHSGMESHTLLQSTFPVLVPHFTESFVSDSEFLAYLNTITVTEARKKIAPRVDDEPGKSTVAGTSTSPFIAALANSDAKVHTHETLAKENKTLTRNADVALLSSTSPLVDLFYSLKDHDVDEDMLEKAWASDSVATLRIIFNARSIHLGKGERLASYRAFGWLYQNHPRTFLINLPWLVRPIIAKPKEKKEEETKDGVKTEPTDIKDDFEIITPDSSAYSTTMLDQEHGMAHGYWKDLLNMLALAANDEFRVTGNPKSILNVESTNKTSSRKRRRTRDGADEEPKKEREWDQEKAKANRKEKLKVQSDIVNTKLTNHPIYRAFHQAVARLFAEQLNRDIAAFKKDGKKAQLSTASKWAPSLKEFHDKHTFIASSIAEIMFSHEQLCPDVPKSDRELYLKHARIAYRFQILTPLRQALDLVEQHISTGKFDKIKYETVPSLAMKRYEKLFVKKDIDHFSSYIEKVALGKKKISGAVLIPSVLVSDAVGAGSYSRTPGLPMPVKAKMLDGQWKTLIDRVRKSGKIESSIAVCDVSGSMSVPSRSDKTTPMDSAIGLSLLLAEIVEPPFGGSIITFSHKPSFFQVGGASDDRDFVQKCKYIQNSHLGYDTNFVAVFEKLILPLAKEHKLRQEDMVKQVFVFSDMQFNQAQSHNTPRWSTSFQRIEKLYKDAGYEMPTMIFWNLAARTTGVPVAADQPGTVLVSGYSQGQMKMFLDNGGFEDTEEEETVETVEDEDGMVKVTKEKVKVDPMKALTKALSHPAYAMLKTVD